jgi:von Willebrand factor type A domain
VEFGNAVLFPPGRQGSFFVRPIAQMHFLIHTVPIKTPTPAVRRANGRLSGIADAMVQHLVHEGPKTLEMEIVVHRDAGQPGRMQDATVIIEEREKEVLVRMSASTAVMSEKVNESDDIQARTKEIAGSMLKRLSTGGASRVDASARLRRESQPLWVAYVADRSPSTFVSDPTASTDPLIPKTKTVSIRGRIFEHLLRGLNKNVVLQVVVFGTGSNVAVLRAKAHFTAADKSVFGQLVREFNTQLLDYDPGTDLVGALETVAKLRKDRTAQDPQERCLVVILTDGRQTVKSTATPKQAADGLRLLGCEVNAFGLTVPPEKMAKIKNRMAQEDSDLQERCESLMGYSCRTDGFVDAAKTDRDTLRGMSGSTGRVAEVAGFERELTEFLQSVAGDLEIAEAPTSASACFPGGEHYTDRWELAASTKSERGRFVFPNPHGLDVAGPEFWTITHNGAAKDVVWIERNWTRFEAGEDRFDVNERLDGTWKFERRSQCPR